MKKVILITLLLTTGCHQMVWFRSQTSPGQEMQDEQACNYEAEKATVAISDAFEQGWRMSDLEARCMNIKGYSRVREDVVKRFVVPDRNNAADNPNFNRSLHSTKNQAEKEE